MRQDFGPIESARQRRAAPPSVLVLDADAPAGLACVQSLGRAGCTVHAAVRRFGTATDFTRWAAQRHMQPAFESVELALQWLIELDTQFAFGLVIPSTEGSLRWLRALPESNSLRQRAQLPSDAALDIALDKLRTTEMAAQLGIPVPASQHIPGAESWPPPLGFPAVLKPARSKVLVGNRLQSLSVAIVRSETERAQVLTAWLPFTAVQEQAWVPGHGFGVEMLFDHGRMVWSFVHERLHEYPLTGGASTLRRAAQPDPLLIDWSRRLLEALAWHGVAMIEWRVDAVAGPRLMEVNPRFWGSLPLTIAAGRDAPRDLLRIAAGEAQLEPEPYRVGATARNPEADLRWFITNLRADRSDSMLLTEPVVGAALGWLRGLAGRETWDGWHWDDPRLLLHKAMRLLGVLPGRVVHGFAAAWSRQRRLRHHRRLLRVLSSTGQVPRRILLLCYGNICRSPFAQLALGRSCPGVLAASGGFHAIDGRATPAHVVEAARASGIELGDWRSRIVCGDDVEQADLVLVMDRANWERVERDFPAAMHKVTQLGFFASPAEDIADPYDMDPVGTAQVLAAIERAVDGLVLAVRLAPC